MSIALFTVVDLETTGLAPPASVIEIGWTQVYFDTEARTVEVLAPEARLFAPQSLDELTPENIAVHHLTPAFLDGLDVADADVLAEIVQKDRPQFLVAAQCSFEQQWLTPEIVGVDIEGKAPFWICTVKAAARLYAEAESHSNQAMRYRLRLDLPEHLAMPPHRAGPDSYVTAHILGRLLSSGGVRARDLVGWTREPRWMPTIRFGKHKGTPWADVPGDYLEWMCAQPDLDADAKHWAGQELERRRAADQPDQEQKP